ncbi:MAG: 1-acyl-sn-glycerol-3-phosphate acyltransferase [Gemmatimonadota bacterium]|jgi:1-acyl-sn-glycerol-3-phosphate acyltransferase
MDGTRHLPSIPALLHRLLFGPVLKLFFGVHVEGREQLDGLERFILVANHNSHLDIFLLFHVLPPRHLRRTHPVAAYDYFARSRALRWLVEFLVQPVWIVRGSGDEDPLAGMRARLAEGRSIIIFPEGTRGLAGAIAPFKKGVGRLASEFPEVPVVPVFLSGPEKALPKTQSLPLPVWNHVQVGRPRRFRGTAGEFTAELEAAVRGLAASAKPRHQRLKRTRRPPTVAVLGIDGSGKSTLSRALARRLSWDGRGCLVTDDVEVFEQGEPVSTPELLAEKLRASLGRRTKIAGSLKSYKIPKLMELLLRDHIVEELRAWYAPDVVVLDGSPLLNITAWTGLYGEQALDEATCISVMRVLSGKDESLAPDDPVYRAFPELGKLKRLHLARMQVPDAVLFLDVDPAVCMERIRRRGEERQVHETEEKLGRLRLGYRMVCRVVERDLHVPARALDGRLDAGGVIAAALEELRHMDLAALAHLTGPGEKEMDPHG